MATVDSSKRQRVENMIFFMQVDAEGVQYPHNNAMIVTLNIENYNVHHVLVDSGS